MQNYFLLFFKYRISEFKIVQIHTIAIDMCLEHVFLLNDLSILVSEFCLQDFFKILLRTRTKILTMLCIIMLLLVIISHSVVKYHYVVLIQ